MQHEFDIIIVGGGIAGISCAYNAATLGLRTLLIEQGAYLGGAITQSLVIPMMKTNMGENNVDFLHALVDFSKKRNAQATFKDNPYWFNPFEMKNIFDEMLKSAGCEIIYNAKVKSFEKICECEAGEIDKHAKNKISMCNKDVNLKNRMQNMAQKISKIEVEQNKNTKVLSLHFYSKYFVDATGNGNFSKILNCKFYKKNKNVQSNTLRFVLSDVDLNSFAQFLSNYADNCIDIEKAGDDIHLSCAYTWDEGKNWALAPIFNQALEDGALKPIDTSYFQLFTIPNAQNMVVFNCPKVISGDIEGAHQAIDRLHAFCRRYFAGFSNSKIFKIADFIGVRGANCPKCEYDYTISDIKENRRFEDEILSSNYPIDIHSDHKNGAKFENCGTYYLPLRAIKSSDYKNLLIVGKHTGADIYTQGALRIQPTCAQIGEAAAKCACQNLFT